MNRMAQEQVTTKNQAADAARPPDPDKPPTRAFQYSDATIAWIKGFVELLLVAAIVGGGIWGTRYLMAQKSTPVPAPQVEIGPLVQAVELKAQDVRALIEGYATAGPRVTGKVVPQVAGRVEWVHPNLVNGGLVGAGEVVVKLDKRDYELTLQRAMAAVERAKVKLELEQKEAEVALKEWKQTHPNEPAPPLLVREPQIRDAMAAIASAELEVSSERLQLERTEVRVPFDARVEDHSVSLGQFASAGQVLASIYGTQIIEAPIPLLDSELEWFDLPKPGAADADATPSPGDEAPRFPVMLRGQVRGREIQWPGRLVRTESWVDSRSRMVNVVAQVRKADLPADTPPLEPGMFLRASIEGKWLKGVMGVPRFAIRKMENRDLIWVARDGRLKIVEAKVARLDQKTAWLLPTDQLKPGDQVIVSSLDIYVDGMKIRLPGSQNSAKPPAAGSSVKSPAAAQTPGGAANE